MVFSKIFLNNLCTKLLQTDEISAHDTTFVHPRMHLTPSPYYNLIKSPSAGP